MADPSDYMKLRLGRSVGYVRKAIKNEVLSLDAIIFDCDGVLVDAQNSYDRAIVTTVKFIFKRLMNQNLPKKAVTKKVLFKFRMSGGFNNDWDTTYALLLTILSYSQGFLNVIRSSSAALNLCDDPASRLEKVRTMLSKTSTGFTNVDEEGLLEVASKADSSGIGSVERALVGMNRLSREDISFIKSFLRYPGPIEKSIISRVFDEFFYGSKLFRELHGLKPIFYDGDGLIKNEKVIVKKETLEQLVRIVGKEKLGLVTGRGSLSTRETLQDLMAFFNLRASVFLEDEDIRKKSTNVEYSKPRPYPLLKAASGLSTFKKAIYVGDSMEDLLMVRNANSLDDRFLFTGIYATTYSAREKLRAFKANLADLLIPTVNMLPELLSLLLRVR